ncbi:MAG: glycosyltransferase [Mobilitalea sp.]
MISICMIVKDEAKILDKCLQELVLFGYEIIIVDTGSTDETKTIAYQYTDKVFDYIWQQDFAAARNYAAEQAGQEYILSIDSDEIVTKADKTELEAEIRKHPKDIGRLCRINDYSRGKEIYSSKERVSRLYSKEYYHYEGRIHEQIVSLKGNANVFYDIPIEMRHVGYEGDLNIRKLKTQRNINLLIIQMELEGEDPYLLYQLGKSYYMQEEYQEAYAWFEKAVAYDLNPDLEYVQDLIETYGYSLLNTGQYAKALLMENIYQDFATSADFVYLMGLIYMNNAKFTEAIRELYKATEMKEYKMEGVNSFRAYYNIGVIYECLGMKNKARDFYEKCGEYPLAENRLKILGNNGLNEKTL